MEGEEAAKWCDPKIDDLPCDCCDCGEMGEFEAAFDAPKYVLAELFAAELEAFEEVVPEEPLLLLVPMCGMTICSSCCTVSWSTPSSVMIPSIAPTWQKFIRLS